MKVSGRNEPSVFRSSYCKGPARWWLPLSAHQYCFEVAEKLLREGACLPKEVDLVALEDPGGNLIFAAFLRKWRSHKAMEMQLGSGIVEHRP